MSTLSVLPGRRATAVVLVLAPLAEVVEALLSPLDGRSTARDLSGISAHQGRFEVSLLFGLIGTVLYVPAFLGLAQACVSRAPRLSRIGAWSAVVSMSGFCVVRGVQLAELALVQKGVDPRLTAQALDHVTADPVGVLVLVAFLGGAFFGTIIIAVAAWRAGFPRPAAVLLGLFQVVDLALPDHPNTLTAASHLLLLVALGWIASVLWSSGPAPEDTREAVVSAPAAP